jgi:lysophospholipid acyltransferase (LPLAT)-like uncharacterized protein
MPLVKRLAGSRPFQVAAGFAVAQYLRFVWKTNRVTVEPEGIYERIAVDLPFILAMWHGQHFLAPFARRAEHRAKVLISRHRDGEINALAVERLGLGTVRGSGSHGAVQARKRGAAAFRQMLTALDEGYILALTADVPKVARVAGLGIVMLARASERPILPLAVATSRRIELDNWDRSAVNLPFGRAAVVAGDLIRVPAVKGDALESYRQDVEDALNRVTDRAYNIVDRRGKPERA